MSRNGLRAPFNSPDFNASFSGQNWELATRMRDLYLEDESSNKTRAVMQCKESGDSDADTVVLDTADMDTADMDTALEKPDNDTSVSHLSFSELDNLDQLPENQTEYYDSDTETLILDPSDH